MIAGGRSNRAAARLSWPRYAICASFPTGSEAPQILRGRVPGREGSGRSKASLAGRVRRAELGRASRPGARSFGERLRRGPAPRVGVLPFASCAPGRLTSTPAVHRRPAAGRQSRWRGGPASARGATGSSRAVSDRPFPRPGPDLQDVRLGQTSVRVSRSTAHKARWRDP
jgi:hypothetical protein